MRQTRVHALDSLTEKRKLSRQMKAARRAGVKAEVIRDVAAVMI